MSLLEMLYQRLIAETSDGLERIALAKEYVKRLEEQV